MPSFTLTPAQAVRFHPLPGHALLYCLPDDPFTVPPTLIIKPESAAAAELKRQAVRRGRIERISWSTYKRAQAYHNETEHAQNLSLGSIVYYYSRADEVDNTYVVVKILQIVAFKDWRVPGAIGAMV